MAVNESTVGAWPENKGYDLSTKVDWSSVSDTDLVAYEPKEVCRVTGPQGQLMRTQWVHALVPIHSLSVRIDRPT